MYDTEKRVELVKKRVHEKYRRKERRGICRLSALCTALSAFLVGTVHTAADQTQITARGMLPAAFDYFPRMHGKAHCFSPPLSARMHFQPVQNSS